MFFQLSDASSNTSSRVDADEESKKEAVKTHRKNSLLTLVFCHLKYVLKGFEEAETNDITVEYDIVMKFLVSDQKECRK